MQYHKTWQKIRSLFNQAIATGAVYASRSALRIQKCQKQKISISIMLNLRSMLATAWQQLTTEYASHAGYVPRTVRLPPWQWYRYNHFSRSTHTTFLPTFFKNSSCSFCCIVIQCAEGIISEQVLYRTLYY